MYQNPSVLFGVVRIRTSSDKIYLAAILLIDNFAKKNKNEKDETVFDYRVHLCYVGG